MRTLAVTVIGVLALYGVAAAQEFKGPPWFSAVKCTRADSDAADKDLDRLSSWSALYRTFKLYKQCDDGSLAEGYSDRVVSLLTERWPTVQALAKLARANREFGNFVLLHVDDLMSPDQGRTIIGNAEKHCPAGAKEICKRLAAKVRSSE
jgi:hypothetical protein